jgi:hypothetical protein
VVCRSTFPSPSSSRPLWLMGCKKPWIWAWPQLWASAITTPHSLSKYTAFWIRKAFLLPQTRYSPLLYYCESAAAVAVAAAALPYCPCCCGKMLLSALHLMLLLSSSMYRSCFEQNATSCTFAAPCALLHVVTSLLFGYIALLIITSCQL